MTYSLEGSLLEVCTCNILCPCWVGEDPDGDGTCDAVVAWHIENGDINGVNVSGQTFAVIAHLPGNVLTPHSWRIVGYVDEGATAEQEQAILGAWTGQLGGPLADMAQLVGEVIGAERAKIEFRVEGGEGTLKIGDVVDTQMAPYKGPSGMTTTLNESIFSNIPGSPAWVSKASHFKRNSARYGLKDVDIQNHNAIQGQFMFKG
jgi:hypothetical protein